ncbi:MAG: hypothetical protein C4341_04370 [Armatimonadota bacterium]
MIVESINGIIKLSGDLTSNQWETIRTAANLLRRQHRKGVVVDCSGLETVTHEGAHTFLDMLLYIEAQNARIIVANVPPHIAEEIRHVPEVRSRLAIANSVEEARKSLTVQQSFSGETKRESATLKPASHLIVALCGGRADRFALPIAAAMAQMRQLSVLVLYPIILQRSLPMTTPMPDQEEAAQESLKTAGDFLKSRSIQYELVMKRGRELYAAIEEVSAAQQERLVIVSLPDQDQRKREPQATADHLLSSVHSELVLVRSPLEEPQPNGKHA